MDICKNTDVRLLGLDSPGDLISLLGMAIGNQSRSLPISGTGWLGGDLWKVFLAMDRRGFVQ